MYHNAHLISDMQHFAMAKILAMKPKTNKIREVQQTIRDGVYAVVLHPETPDRALYMLATGKLVLLLN